MPTQNKYTIDYVLKRGVAEIISESELRKLLLSGKKLRIKEGLDPSSPDIHVGHMASLRKMRQFQELGHQIVIIVGDWTAQIGDPSGRSATRPMLTAEQVNANAETYLKQFFKIVDKNKTEIRMQSEWFGKFNLADVVRLTSKFTVAQFLAREDFSKRFSEQKPIAISELLYPLMQAYDSVAVKADMEMGGTDQKFNFLVGRELQSMMGQPQQQILMVPLLVGTDGVQKMSKSLGNYIGVTEPPEDIYGKTMSIKDDVILLFMETVTDIPDAELSEFKKQMDSGANPMLLKKRLAHELVTQLYSEKEADAAAEHFEKTVQKKELPEEIPEIKLNNESLTKIKSSMMKEKGSLTSIEEIGKPDTEKWYVLVPLLLCELKMASSRSEANRLINQGAVSIDGKKIDFTADPNIVKYGYPIKNGSIVKAGKR
jgi:tyrosyl-tRNA synthetase